MSHRGWISSVALGLIAAAAGCGGREPWRPAACVEEAFAARAALLERWCPPGRLLRTTDVERRATYDRLITENGSAFQVRELMVGTPPVAYGAAHYRAVSCRPPSEPADNPYPYARITTYLIEHRRGEVITLLTLSAVEPRWGLALFTDRFLELLDPPDRETARQLVAASMARNGGLEPA
jgi:hypothetical protein